MSTAIDTLLTNAVRVAQVRVGKPVTLTRTVPGEYNELTGVRGEDVVTNHPARTVGPPMNYSEDQINDTTVLRGDLRIVLLAADLAIIPTSATDTVTMGGETFKVVDAQRNYGSEAPLLYVVQVRR